MSIGGRARRKRTHLVISLDSTILLSSFTTIGPIHTENLRQQQLGNDAPRLTFFADETVVSVVGVVGISQTTMRVLEFKEFVAMFA